MGKTKKKSYKKDEFNIKILQKNKKLLDIDKLMDLYDKLLNYMKKFNNTEYTELKDKIDKKKIKEKKS